RAGGHIDVIGCAYQLSLKLAPGKLGQTEVCGHTCFHALRVLLWHVYVNTQRPRLRDVKEVGLHSATATRIDEVPNVGVSGCDDSVKWRVDLLERLESL